jgi:hypothetical protein
MMFQGQKWGKIEEKRGFCQVICMTPGIVAVIINALRDYLPK